MRKKISVFVKKKIKNFDKKIYVESDKSISHRSLLIASQCIGLSNIKNILESDDIRNTIIYSDIRNFRLPYNCKKETRRRGG